MSICERFATVVGLVDEHEVREFHDAALDALQLVTGARLQQEEDPPHAPIQVPAAAAAAADAAQAREQHFGTHCKILLV